MPAKRKISILAGLIFLVVSLRLCVSAQTSSNNKEIEGLPAALAIAQFIDGRFLLVGLNGKLQQFDLRPYEFFTLARSSPDGKMIVGLSGRTITVLNKRLERVWQRNQLPGEFASATLSALS